MTKEFDPRRLDIRRFAEEGARLQAESPLRLFGRLLEQSQPPGIERTVTWSAQGEIRNPRHVHPQYWLHLDAEARLALVCQRCLGAVDVAVTVDRSFRFVADEATAAAEDEDAEEEVLALSRQFDLLELIEDEILLDQPAVPRHVVCPVPVTMSAADEDFEEAESQRKNPFAALGQLKGSKPQD